MALHAHFLRCLGEVRQGLGVIHYINDILIGAANAKEHLQKLIIVFAKLQEFGFKVKAAKLHLLMEAVKYEGHSVSCGKCSLKPYIAKRMSQIPLVEGRKSLQKAVGVLNVLKSSTPHFAKLLGDFYAVVAKMGAKEKWEKVNEMFRGAME